ncbi:hypothetical protein HII31_13316 [Pseudocercospora fuligena]|uniref:F-box domain-containing protein n=1 Tax=Pseudocercospora fuligena TaxID=685502 RepID=A0A8H6VC88_9PEZI|nr:hypothetical protein HII31_13316 [Pseudocercospora fuligena]
MQGCRPHLLRLTSVALTLHTPTPDNNMSSPSRLLMLPEELLIIVLDHLDSYAVRNARLCCRQFDNLLLEAFSNQIPKQIRCCFVDPVQLQSLHIVTKRHRVSRNINTIQLTSRNSNDYIDPRRGNGYLTGIIGSYRNQVQYAIPSTNVLQSILENLSSSPHIDLWLDETLLPNRFGVPVGMPYILPILAVGPPVGLVHFSLHGYGTVLNTKDLVKVICNSQGTLQRFALRELILDSESTVFAIFKALRRCEKLHALELFGLSEREEGKSVLFVIAVEEAGGRSDFVKIRYSVTNVRICLDANLAEQT